MNREEHVLEIFTQKGHEISWSIKGNDMRRLNRIFTGFLLGGAVGAAIGALGGTMDQGSTLILMPSGPPFWAIIGAFFGSIVGALYGALSKSSSQGFTYIKSGGRNERDKKDEMQERLGDTDNEPLV